MCVCVCVVYKNSLVSRLSHTKAYMYTYKEWFTNFTYTQANICTCCKGLHSILERFVTVLQEFPVFLFFYTLFFLSHLILPFVSIPPALFLLTSLHLCPSSVPLLFINLNLSVCAPWSEMSTQSKHAQTHPHWVMGHIIRFLCSQCSHHRQACKENQITFVCPDIFLKRMMSMRVCICAQVFIQDFVSTVYACLQACVHETIVLPCSQAVRSSEMRQRHITLQDLI